MKKQEELNLCKKFIGDIKDNNKSQALLKMNKLVESKIERMLESKKQAIKQNKNF